MSNLAIKGHATRGKEVIEILEMLGGNNTIYYLHGSDENAYYYIHHDYIDCGHKDMIGEGHPEFKHYTLEEFLEKFPYKIGDNVIHSDYESPLEIVGMKWEDDSIKYEVYTNDYGYWFSVDELQPYKEETMEATIKIDIPKGYEFAGVDDDKQQVVFEKIGYHYPKTYWECCEVLGLRSAEIGVITLIYSIKYGEAELYRKFIELKRCRDAYWKIAGEQMGLDKPWKPDWSKADEKKYCIVNTEGNIKKWVQKTTNKILAFPTEEMRDAFYENFKSLINECKELL